MAAPERFAEKSDLPLQRGHRPYMARFSSPGRVTAWLFPGVLLPGLPLVGEAEDDLGVEPQQVVLG